MFLAACSIVHSMLDFPPPTTNVVRNVSNERCNSLMFYHRFQYTLNNSCDQFDILTFSLVFSGVEAWQFISSDVEQPQFARTCS